MPEEPRRKGAVRRSSIPPDVLLALNEGREETITLVEWLAIDMPTLLRSVLPQVGLESAAGRLAESTRPLADEGVRARLIGYGEALFETLDSHPKQAEVFEALASHKSDMVRSWAAWMVAADRTLELPRRLEAVRRFAADPAGAVRENAWDSFRSYVAADLTQGLHLLEIWVRDPDPNVRRCAVEGTRPRGVWATHIEALKKDPGPGLRLLGPVRSDPSRYVQRAVANWLNDASKSRADWVRAVCARWRRESPTKETAWTVHHAMRTIRKTEQRGV